MKKLEDYWATKTDIECTEEEFYRLIPLLNEMRKNLNINKGGSWDKFQWANVQRKKLGYINMDFHSIGYTKTEKHQIVQASLFLIPVYEIIENYEIC